MPAVKPVPKGATKTTAKPTAASGKTVKAAANKTKPVAAAKTPTPPPPPKYNAGDIAKFAGYKQAVENPLFGDVGELVYVHSLGERDYAEGHPLHGKRKQTVFYCTTLADMEAAKADPGLEKVNAQELEASELRVYKAPVEEPEYHPVAIGQVDELVKANHLTPVVKKLLAEQAETAFDIGGVLAFVYYERMSEVHELGYRDQDEDGNDLPLDNTDKSKVAVTAWERYLRTEFDMAPRTAEDHIKIYKHWSSVPDFDPSVLARSAGGIGWSKASVAATYLLGNDATPEERKARADEIVELAKNEDIRTLRQTIKERYVQGEGGSTPSGGRTSTRAKRVQFGPYYLDEAQATGVKMILEQAGKAKRLSENANLLFETIVREWGTQNLTGPVMAKVNQAIEKAQPAAKAKTAVKPAPAAQPKARVVKARPQAAAQASA